MRAGRLPRLPLHPHARLPYAPPHAESLSFALAPFTAPSTLFSLAFPTRFPSVPAIALAISDLAFEGDGSSGSSWVTIDSKDASGVTVRLVRQSSTWNIRKVQLWASVHP